MTEWWLQTQFELPVFPLPNIVHFPSVVVPLHVFEPRYRALVKDAMANDGRMALALLKPGYEDDYYGTPGVYPITCAGQIINHKELPDGRYYMMVMGLGRIALQEQTQSEPYRKFRAKPLLESALHEPSAALQIQTFFACLQQLAQTLPEITKAMKELSQVRANAGQLADVAASLFINEPAQRQSLLELLDPQLRLQRMTDALSELMLQTETHKKSPLN
jgi:uncharacterized protein